MNGIGYGNAFILKVKFTKKDNQSKKQGLMTGMVEIERKILGLLRLLGTVLCNSKFYQSFRVGFFRKGSKMDYTITVAALTALVTSLASKGAEGPAHTINLMRILSTKILK